MAPRLGQDSVLVTRILRVQRAVLVTAGRGAPDYYRDDFQGWHAQTWSSEPPPIEQYNVLSAEYAHTVGHTQRQGRVEGHERDHRPGQHRRRDRDLANLLIARMKADGVI